MIEDLDERTLLIQPGNESYLSEQLEVRARPALPPAPPSSPCPPMPPPVPMPQGPHGTESLQVKRGR